VTLEVRVGGDRRRHVGGHLLVDAEPHQPVFKPDAGG